MPLKKLLLLFCCVALATGGAHAQRGRWELSGTVSRQFAGAGSERIRIYDAWARSIQLGYSFPLGGGYSLQPRLQYGVMQFHTLVRRDLSDFDPQWTSQLNGFVFDTALRAAVPHATFDLFLQKEFRCKLGGQPFVIVAGLGIGAQKMKADRLSRYYYVLYSNKAGDSTTFKLMDHIEFEAGASPSAGASFITGFRNGASLSIKTPLRLGYIQDVGLGLEWSMYTLKRPVATVTDYGAEPGNARVYEYATRNHQLGLKLLLYF